MIGCILLNCFALRVILYILMINDLIVVLMSRKSEAHSSPVSVAAVVESSQVVESEF